MDDNIRLTDLISAQMLQKIQDAFAQATGMAALTVDLDGPVTQLSCPTDFCMKLTRQSAVGAERCNQCDLKGGQEAGRTGRPSVYFCHGGLMDFAAPILVNGKQIGSMIGGQVLPNPPDENKFRKIAREINVNEEEYVRALRKVKIVPQKTIESAAKLLYVLANAMSEMGYQQYSTQQMVDNLKGASKEMHQKVESAISNVSVMESQNKQLVTKIDELVEITKSSQSEVEQTNQILQYISNISMQTKLLGFNASVEASRAKEHGAGFNVIAKEIRRLAETSQEQSDRIDQIITSVKHTIKSISDNMQNTQSSAQSNAETLKKISDYIQEIGKLANDLQRMS